MPPIRGAAIRFITSEPVPIDHMIENRPWKVVAVVMNFGRRRRNRHMHYRSAQFRQTARTALLFDLRVG